MPEKFPHKIPADFQKAINSNSKTKEAWKEITPLAKNEFICWVTSAKLKETREKRIKRACEDLLNGKRRPCCWAGCKHRNPTKQNFIYTHFPPLELELVR